MQYEVLCRIAQEMGDGRIDDEHPLGGRTAPAADEGTTVTENARDFAAVGSCPVLLVEVLVAGSVAG